MKNKKDSVETVVAYILTRFMFTRSMEDVFEVWEEIYDYYDLADDPFTGCPVSREEYSSLKEEYERQLEDIRDCF